MRFIVDRWPAVSRRFIPLTPASSTMVNELFAALHGLILLVSLGTLVLVVRFGLNVLRWMEGFDSRLAALEGRDADDGT